MVISRMLACGLLAVGYLQPAQDLPPPLRVDAIARPAGSGSAHWTLIARMHVPKDLHVYAESGPGYEAASVTLAPPAGMKASDVRWPPSSDLLFALSQPVKVYDGIVEAEVTVELSRGHARALRAGRDVVVRGILRYQSCTDDACFRPREVALTWTLRRASSTRANGRS